ncbi:MAG: hypothetical protein ACJ76H_02910, partial [Bacteriovoracaceae bacterium]
MKTLILLLSLFILVSCQPSSSSGGSAASAETESSFLRGGESRLIKPPLRNNTAPVVAAGTDITVTDADKNGSEVIHLNGYATDAENNITTCQLYRNGVLVIAGGDDSVFRTPQTLSVGSYEFLMKATDSKGLHSSDTVVVNVNAAPPTPPVIVVNSAPVVNAGPDFAVTDADNNGSESVKLAGSATDSDNNITTYVVAVDGFSVLNGSTAATLTNSITLKVGTHTIAMAATDSGGLKGTDTVIITVKAPAVTNTAPVVNAGSDIVVTDQDKNGSEMINLAGSASDA